MTQNLDQIETALDRLDSQNSAAATQPENIQIQLLVLIARLILSIARSLRA